MKRCSKCQHNIHESDLYYITALNKENYHYHYIEQISKKPADLVHVRWSRQQYSNSVKTLFLSCGPVIDLTEGQQKELDAEYELLSWLRLVGSLK